MSPFHIRCGLLIASLAAVGLSACRSYERRPLMLDAHRTLWESRTPASEPVRSFAETLRAPHVPEADFDLADGLQVHEAEIVALVFNPRLRRIRAEAAITAASAQHAGTWEDPVLGVGLEHILSGTSHPNVYSGTVGLTLPVSGRLEAERQRLGYEHAARLIEIAAEEWAVRQDVRRAWARWTAAATASEVTASYLADMVSLRSAVDALERAGEISRVQAGAFALEQLSADRELDAQRADEELHELALRRLLGLSPEAEMSIRPGFPSVAEPEPEPGPLSQSPRVLVAAARYEAAERSLAEQIRAQYPDIQIGPGFGREDGADRVLLGLTLPIPLWNRNARGMAEAEAAREAARIAAETAVEEVLQDLAAARVRRGVASRRLHAVETGLSPIADRQREDALALAQMGELDTLLLLEVFRRVHEVKLALVQSRLEECLAAIDLAELTGPPVPPVDPSVKELP